MRWLKDATEVADTFAKDIDKAVRARAVAVAKRREMEAVSQEDVYVAIGEIVNDGASLKDLLGRLFTDTEK